MSILQKTIATLKPVKELIAIVVFLAGAAYGAITHFATAKQLATVQEKLDQKLQAMQVQSSVSLAELKCLNSLNRDYLRAQIEEVGLRGLLDKNLEKANLLSSETGEFAEVELVKLTVNRETLITKIGQVESEKREILISLQEGSCSTSS